jgi:hypothetical protein
MVLVGALFVLTIRTAWMFNYLNYDSARRSSASLHMMGRGKRAMRQIEALADRLGEGQQFKIAPRRRFRAGPSTGTAGYANQVPVDSPSRSDLMQPVIIASAKSGTRLKVSCARRTRRRNTIASGGR